MKILKALAITGNLLMLVGCIFLIINLAINREIFPEFVTLPLILMGIVGNVCSLIINNKRK